GRRTGWRLSPTAGGWTRTGGASGSGGSTSSWRRTAGCWWWCSGIWLAAAGICRGCMTEYVELHAHSYFSLLDGASSPEALVARTAALEMPALALTDHDAVYGAVRFEQAARAQGIRPILGAELSLSDGTHLTLLVENATGWHTLCRLISLARHHAPKGEASLPVEALAAYTEGLLALSGCRQGAVAKALQRGDERGAQAAAGRLREWFGR